MIILYYLNIFFGQYTIPVMHYSRQRNEIYIL